VAPLYSSAFGFIRWEGEYENFSKMDGSGTQTTSVRQSTGTSRMGFVAVLVGGVPRRKSLKNPSAAN
jgi:hypothetical protein